MRVTVLEQGRVALGDRLGGLEGAAALSHSEATALVAAGDRMQVRLASWDDPNVLRMHQFVGAVRIGPLEIEILPKIETAPDEMLVRRNLLGMLVVAENLDLKPSEAVGYLQSQEPVLAALARLFCRRLSEALRRGLRQEYVVLEDLLTHIRGRVSWPAQARIQASQCVQFACVFDERSEDTPFNRALKGALRRAGAMQTAFEDLALVDELRHVMSGVADSVPSPDHLARLHTDRLNRHLEPLLTLAKLLLGNRNPDVGRSTVGDDRSYALVWDMNVLFERFVGRVVARTLKGAVVELQHSSTYLAEDHTTRGGAFLLRPDILVGRGSQRVLVADTKCKRLDPNDSTLGVSGADAYQLVAYARRFQVHEAALIYPHRPGLRQPPGLQRRFRVGGVDAQALTLSVVTVDLADLDAVAGQLHTAVQIAA